MRSGNGLLVDWSVNEVDRIDVMAVLIVVGGADMPASSIGSKLLYGFLAIDEYKRFEEDFSVVNNLSIADCVNIRSIGEECRNRTTIGRYSCGTESAWSSLSYDPDVRCVELDIDLLKD